MPTIEQTLQADISNHERALRTLIGEQKALRSRVAREQAIIKMETARLHSTKHLVHPNPAALHVASRFPDVSSYQPNVNLNAVAHGGSERVGGMFVHKATEGTGWVDAFFASRWHIAHQVGIPHRGAYHFLHPSESPSSQADHFLSILLGGGRTAGSSDVVICDAEVSDGMPGHMVVANIREWGQRVKQHVAAKLWLYTGGPFAQGIGLQGLNPYDAYWLAAYASDYRQYAVLGKPIAWQYTDGIYGPTPHSCPGIGACDMSIVL